MGLLAGPEPDAEIEERRYPGGNRPAHAIWRWCQDRGVDIRKLALEFCLKAPLNGNGMVLAGPATRQEVQEVYEAATNPVSNEVWRDFEVEFGVGV